MYSSLQYIRLKNSMQNLKTEENKHDFIKPIWPGITWGTLNTYMFWIAFSKLSKSFTKLPVRCWESNPSLRSYASSLTYWQSRQWAKAFVFWNLKMLILTCSNPLLSKYDLSNKSIIKSISSKYDLKKQFRIHFAKCSLP